MGGATTMRFSLLVLLQIGYTTGTSIVHLTKTVAFSVLPNRHVHHRQRPPSVLSFSTWLWTYTPTAVTRPTTAHHASISSISSDDDHHHHHLHSAARSRYYPPSRIPVRRCPSENQGAALYPVWFPGQRAYLRHRFVVLLQEQQPLSAYCQVEWVDNLKSMLMGIKSSVGSNRNDPRTFQYEKLLTMASLWNILGNVTTTTAATAAATTAKNHTTVMALPDVDGYLVEQFVTMAQWLLAASSSSPALWVSYRNTVVDFTTIPTLILTRPSVTRHNDDVTSPAAPPTNSVQYNHNMITLRTKSWVQRLLVDATICPFTKSTTYSGQGLTDVQVPVGKIAYHTSQSSVLDFNNTTAAVCHLQSDVLVAIHDMLQAGPTSYRTSTPKGNGISSILLAAPGWDDHFDLWTQLVFPILEATIQVLDLTEQIGIVCFHPFYQTPDGRSFPGFGHMHSVPRLQQWLQDHKPFEDVELAIECSIPDLVTSNEICSSWTNKDGPSRADNDKNHHDHRTNTTYQLSVLATAGGAWQRRTPHATINVLRADQLAAAESKRSTPTLYSTNILRLSRIGWSQLHHALDYERKMSQ